MRRPLIQSPAEADLMSDAIAFLRRAIEQGQGLAEADMVLKGGRIFDLVGG
jgi:adenine deaminase